MNRPAEVEDVIGKCVNLLPKISEPIEFERIYKLILQETLQALETDNKPTLKEIIEQVERVQERRPVVEIYSNGYRVLKKLLVEGKFRFKQILSVLPSIQRHYDEILQHNYIPNTKEEIAAFADIDNLSEAMVWTIKGWLQMFGSSYLYSFLD